MSEPMSQEEVVLARIRAVPEGFVTTYRDVWPAAPRFTGHVLSHCDDPAIPWQRVVHADGSLAKGERQRRLLAAEGVPFRRRRVQMDAAHVPAEALDQLASPATARDG